MKNNIKKTFRFVLLMTLCIAMVLGGVACGKGDGTVTFHYGFDTEKAKLDKNGKASKYTDTLEVKSQEGKRISLTTKMKETFAVEGYEIAGYSKTDWQKDGITRDMDVYVLYRKLKTYTVTFLNPDGSKIKEIEKVEKTALEEADYPTEEEIKVSSGLDFVGWDTNFVDSINKDMKIKALEGVMTTFEAEAATYFASSSSAVTVTEANDESGKSVYMNMYPNDGFVTIDFTIHAEQDAQVIWDINMGFRSGGENRLDSGLSFSIKAAGQQEFTPVTTEGVIRNSNWEQVWGDMGTATVATIDLKKGENHLRIEGIKFLVGNVDSIALKGDAKGIYSNPYPLTLNGATFSDGSSTMNVEAGSKVPSRVKVAGMKENQEVVGWTDGTNTWGINDFAMPEKALTISPVVEDKKVPTEPKDVKAIKKEIKIDGKKDDSYIKVDSSLKRSTIAKFTEGSTEFNENNYADVYMAAKDNGVYVFVEVTDDKVVSAGKNYYDADNSINFRNDMIEFWFTYDGLTSKIQMDAFGYKLRSSDDGLAVGYPKIAEVEFATALTGDNKLDTYKQSGDAVVTNATGYTIEFWLPLCDKGESVVGSSMQWALQINSINDTTRRPVSVNGHKLKTEAEQKSEDKVFTANFVK